MALIIKGRSGNNNDFSAYVNSLKAFGDLFLLLDAKRSSKLLSSSGKVEIWEDLSDYKNHAIQPIESSQANYDNSLNNGRTGLMFNGSSTYYNAQFFGSVEQRTILFYGGLNTLSNTGRFAGGGVISVETASAIDGPNLFTQFDALVYAERTALRWMNGSSNFLRTPLTDSSQNETELNGLRIAYSFGTSNFTMWKYNTQLSTTSAYAPLSITNGFFKIGARHTALTTSSIISQNPWNTTRTSAANGFFNGFVSAIAVYRNVLNISNITSIFDILAT
jgi:hypothetical protein